MHVFVQVVCALGRRPQSAQSVPMSPHIAVSAPGPPSSQEPSLAQLRQEGHVFVQMVCALVKPTIMARKMVRASRGTDLKRPAEPRRAEHDREAEGAHIVSGRGTQERNIRKASDRASEFLAIDLPKQVKALTQSRRRSSEMPADETQKPTRRLCSDQAAPAFPYFP